MLVKLTHASAMDAKVMVKDDGMEVEPKFYTPGGSCVLGTLVCQGENNVVLDRAILRVSGKGKISVVHRNEHVTPKAETATQETE